MQQLENIQESFFASVFNASKSVDFVASNYPEKRMDIYRNNIIENLRNALALTFPKSWKLLGDNCANSVAYNFIKARHLPNTGVFDEWGGDFSFFLSYIDELKSVPYISDFARYEWLSHQAYLSAVSAHVDASEFSKFSEEEIENLKIKFLPSIFLYESKYPIDQINEVTSNPDAPAIDLEKRGSYAIIYRPYLEVITLWISHEEYVFFNALSCGMSLSEAIRYCEEDEIRRGNLPKLNEIATSPAAPRNDAGSFNLTQCLLFAMTNKLIERINL